MAKETVATEEEVVGTTRALLQIIIIIKINGVHSRTEFKNPAVFRVEVLVSVRK